MCLSLQAALCIVHTTKYYYVWSPTQKWKKWRRSTMLFFTLGSTTLFMSHSFRWRVGHPARAVFGTLRRKSWNASIHQKWKIIINRQWYYFFVNQSVVILYHAVSLLLDTGKNTSVRLHVGRRPSWSTAMHAELQGRVTPVVAPQ